MIFLKLFSREKSTQGKKVLFIKGNEIITEVELLSFLIFESVYRITLHTAKIISHVIDVHIL